MTFDYEVSDGSETSTATVTVTVGNAAPVAVDDVADTDPDTAVDVDVLANDTDPNIPLMGDVLTVADAVASDGASSSSTSTTR